MLSARTLRESTKRRPFAAPFETQGKQGRVRTHKDPTPKNEGWGTRKTTKKQIPRLVRQGGLARDDNTISVRAARSEERSHTEAHSQEWLCHESKKKRAGVEIELRPFFLLLLARFVATSSLSLA
jgi:hypothetical protein